MKSKGDLSAEIEEIQAQLEERHPLGVGQAVRLETQLGGLGHAVEHAAHQVTHALVGRIAIGTVEAGRTGRSASDGGRPHAGRIHRPPARGRSARACAHLRAGAISPRRGCHIP